MTAVALAIGLCISAMATPGVTWAARSGKFGNGMMLWLCEHTSGEFRADIIEMLCARDALAAMLPTEQRRLATVMMADALSGPDSLPQNQERAMLRFVIAGSLAMDQVQAYDAMVERQVARAPKWKMPVPPPPTGAQIVLEHYGKDWYTTERHGPDGWSQALRKKRGGLKPHEAETKEVPEVTW